MLAALEVVSGAGLSAAPTFAYSPPYSGVTTFTNHTASAAGCKTVFAHNFVRVGFNSTTGIVAMGSVASASSCARTGSGNFSGYAEEDIEVVGPCWVAANTATVTSTINISFRYHVNVSARSGPVDGFPVASYQLLAYPWIENTTTHKSSPAQGDYHNSTVFYLVNASYSATVQANITFLVKLPMISGDRYCFEFYALEDVHVWVGPGTSSAYAAANFGTRGNGIRIETISY